MEWNLHSAFGPKVECGPLTGLLRAIPILAVETHGENHEQMASLPVLNPTSPIPMDEEDVGRYFDDPPEGMVQPQGDGKPWISRRGRKVDYARLDALNRQLGRLGEQFAVEVERHRLIEAGRDDLAARDEWVAETSGDGVGFDVLSFDGSDDSEWWIEVKTTGLGKYLPFVVTAKEVQCSEDLPERFRLYRVFDFSRSPRLYALKGALSQVCCLEPTLYRAFTMPINNQTTIPEGGPARG